MSTGLMLLSQTGARAQGQQLGFPGSYIEMCGIGLPVATIKDAFREVVRDGLAERGYPHALVTATFQLRKGQENDTSRDDIVNIDVQGSNNGVDLTRNHARIRFIPGEYGDVSDLAFSEMLTQYACPDPPERVYPPTFFVVRYSFWRFGVTGNRCAGDDCEDQAPMAEEARCTLQNALQTQVKLLTNALWELPKDPPLPDPSSPPAGSPYALIDTALGLAEGSFDGWEQRFRTTILEAPYLLTWRIPAYQDSLTIVRQVLARNAEVLDNVGLVLLCDHGLVCGAAGDDDHDGWCNDVDVCPGVFNFENSPGDLDGDGVPDVCDNCVPPAGASPALAATYANPDQFDFDGDLLGNTCDDDDDNDGILDGMDIESMNSTLRFDLDQDGIPDHDISHSTPWDSDDIARCVQECDSVASQVEDHYGTLPLEWDQWQTNCLALCRTPADNCAPHEDSSWPNSCREVYSAAAGYPTAAQGPALEAALDECRDLFYNRDQAPAGAAVGYRCQSRILELSAEITPHMHTSTGSYPPTCTQDTVELSFRANSGPLEGETWNAVSLEACYCDKLTQDGDWSPDCYSFRCRRTQRHGWHPITSTDFHGTEFIDPTTGGTVWTADIRFHGDPAAMATVLNVDPALGLGMARDREYRFERALGSNLHQHDWPWQHTYTYPDGTFNAGGVHPYDLASTVNTLRPVKVRAGWAHDAPGQSGSFDADSVTFSDGVMFLDDGQLCSALPGSDILDWRFVLPWEPYIQPGGLWDPAPRLWGLLQTADGLSVATFAGESLALSRVQPVTDAGGVPLPALGELRLTRARMAADLLGLSGHQTDALFAYAPGSALDGAPGGDVVPAPASMWIGLVSSQENLWQPAADLLGSGAATVPALSDAHLFFDEAAQTLYLLGRQELLSTGEARTRLAALDLRAGAWLDLGEVPALSPLAGYGATYDPVRHEILVVGGAVGGSWSQAVLAIRVPSKQVRVVAGGSPALARTAPGVSLDASARRLYVFGGMGPDGPTRELVSVRLDASTATVLYTVGPDAPGLGSWPGFRYDPASETLQVLSSSSTEPGSTLGVHSLRLSEGIWRQDVLLSGPPTTEPGTAEGTFAAGDDVRYVGQGRADAGYPGEVRLLEVEAESPGLALRVTAPQESVLAQDDRDVTRLAAVVLAPPEVEYLARIHAGASFQPGSRITYLFRDRPATLEPDGLLAALPGATTVAPLGGVAFVGHAFGVTALGVPQQGALAPVASVPLAGLVQQVLPLGTRQLLVVQTLARHDLVVLDVSQPEHLTVMGHLALPGRCRSVALSGMRAYLACGGRGVAVLDVSNPTEPALLDWIHTPGLAVTAAISGDLLLVGRSGRRLLVYRLAPSASPVLLSQTRLEDGPVALRASAGLVQVAEAGPLGWAACAAGLRCGPGRTVEVFRVDPATGTLLPAGTYGGSGDPWQRALWARSVGSRVLVPTLAGVQGYRAQATP